MAKGKAKGNRVERNAWDYAKPQYRSSDVRPVAMRHAEAWKSDPFAYRRIMKDMLAGYVLPSDVAHDAGQLLAQRDAARAAKFAQQGIV